MATHSTLRNSLAEKATQITRRELQVYSQRTKGSQEATARARTVMSLGVPSSFQFYDPHPIVVRRAQAAWMEDVDGNRYVDYDMGFGALFARTISAVAAFGCSTWFGAAVLRKERSSFIGVSPVTSNQKGLSAARSNPPGICALSVTAHSGRINSSILSSEVWCMRAPASTNLR